MGLGDTPMATITSSASRVSICPSTGTGLRLPDASGSPNSITCSLTCCTLPLSSPRYSMGLCRVRKRTPSSFACSTSSRRAGISSSLRRYTIVASAPKRLAVRTESMAVFPPPTTTTCLPFITGVSCPASAAPIRLTRVRYSLLDITPIRFSPGIFMNRGRPAPEATKIPTKPCSCRSSILSVLPMIVSVRKVTPSRRRPSISTSTILFGKRNSGIPYFSTPPISCSASNTVTS